MSGIDSRSSPAPTSDGLSDVPQRAVAASDERLRRVLYVMGLNPAMKFGSLEEQVLELARAFRARGGHFVPVFSEPLGGRALAEYESAGIAAEALCLHRFGLGILWRLLGLIRRQRIGVVHWSFYHPLSPYVWAISVFQPQVRHIFTDHNSRFTLDRPAPGRIRRMLKAILLSRYERIVCVSDFVREDLQRREGVMRPMLTLAHFINTQRFRPEPDARESVRRKLDAESRFVLLGVGHLISYKGFDVLLRALAELSSSAVAWIVGDGPDRSRLEGLARELGLGRRVWFLGNQAEVQPYIQAADCLVCPSVWGEAAGLVNIEGLACGLPVLASRVGGIPEIVDHEISGLLFEPGDVAGLAAATRRLHEDPALRESMGRAARRIAMERFSVESRIEDYLDLYRDPRSAERKA